MPQTSHEATRSLLAAEPGGLLAVDCGLRTGLAHYGSDGRLLWAGSRHLGSMAQLRRAAVSLLNHFVGIDVLILEGSGPIADAWKRAAADRSLATGVVSAEEWRTALLTQRHQRTGAQAKLVSVGLAREVMRWSGLALPHSLSDDAAEAILAGLHAAMVRGWLREPLPFLTPPPLYKDAHEQSRVISQPFDAR